MTHVELVSAVADMAAENERLRVQIAQVEKANVYLQERFAERSTVRASPDRP